MPQACFGKGQESLVDPSVRSAFQLGAKDFSFDTVTTEQMDDILQTIKTDLRLETDLVAEPYSLNMYEKGGKFVKHKDTPRGDDMVGTLLFCLPSLFTGGTFEVTMGMEKKNYFTSWGEEQGGYYAWWRPEYYGEEKVKTVPWAAFFADVDHEVCNVSGGMRVTVAYLLRRKDALSAKASLPREISEHEQTSIIQEEMGQALRNKDFLENGGKIGYPCLHLYTNTQVFPGGKTSDDPLTDKQIRKLKGRDLIVANAAAMFGLDVYLVPYLSHAEQGDLCDLRLQKFPKKKRCPKYMSEDDVKDFFDGERNSENEMELPTDHADVWMLDYGDVEQPKAKVGSTDNYNYEGYFGNEASYTTFYVKSALFIEVPWHSEDRGAMTTSPTEAKKRKTR